jgi:hypothetical protein
MIDVTVTVLQSPAFTIALAFLVVTAILAVGKWVAGNILPVVIDALLAFLA